MTISFAVKRQEVQFLVDVTAGLSRPRKRLPAKYFYDAAGSTLFDRITELDEYYLTRTELSIMREHAEKMAAHCGSRCLMIELGAGSLVKVRLLLDRINQLAAYVPVDVSEEHLQLATKELRLDYPKLRIHPVTADFTRGFDLPAISASKKIVYFPGSTIGNFEPVEADSLLRVIAKMVGSGGGMLLGIDLIKDPAILVPAYDDALGITAAFNRNLLVRINRELHGDFNPELFRHRAIFNAAESRMEMHLVSTIDQEVRIWDRVFSFSAGESIHTENSYKYDLAEFSSRALNCGFRVDEVWTDPNRYFAVAYLTATGSSGVAS